MKFRTRNFLILTMILLFLLTLINLPKNEVFQTEDIEGNYQILFISSYSPEFSTFDDQLRGLEEVFHKYHLNFSYMFMDSKRFPIEQVEQLFYQEFLMKKEVIQEYEVIITADDNALNFVLDHYDEFFYDKPIIFFGLNDIKLAKQLNINPNITGIIEETSIKETIDLILDIYPNTKEVIAISDNTTTGQIDLQNYLKLQQDYDIKLSFLDLSNYTFEEFYRELNKIKLEDNKSLLLISAFRDKQNDSLSFSESVNNICQNANVPIFHLWNHGIGMGLLGGKVVSQHSQARLAAELTIQVLSGTPISTISVIDNSPNENIFDYDQLKKFNIDPKQLPDDSIIINQPRNILNQYKTEIFTLIIIFLLLTLWIIHLIVLNKDKREMLDQLEKVLTLNKLYLESMFEGVIILNNENIIQFINKSALTILGYEYLELENKDFIEIAKNLKPNEDINNLNYLLSLATSSSDHIGKSFIYSHPTKGEKFLSYKAKEIILENNQVGLIINIEDNGIVQRITEKLSNYQEILNNIIEINNSDPSIKTYKNQAVISKFIEQFLECKHAAYIKLNNEFCKVDEIFTNFEYTPTQIESSNLFCQKKLEEDTIMLSSEEINSTFNMSNSIGIVSKLNQNKNLTEYLLLILPEKFEPNLDWWRVFNLLISILKNILQK